MRRIETTYPQALPPALRSAQIMALPIIRGVSPPPPAPIAARAPHSPAYAAQPTAGPLAAWLPPHFSPFAEAGTAGALPRALAGHVRVTWAHTLPCEDVIAAAESHVLIWCGYPPEQLRYLRQLVGRSGRVRHVWGVATLIERERAWQLVRQFLVIRVLWCEPWSLTGRRRPVPHWHRPQIMLR